MKYTYDYNARVNGTYDKAFKTVGRCIYCEVDRDSIIKEDKYSYLVVNNYPYLEGHLLIAPKRHIELMHELDNKEWESLRGLFVLGSKLLRKELDIVDTWFIFRNGKGFNGGKTVPHMHVHILPFDLSVFRIKYKSISFHPLDLAKDLRELIKSGVPPPI